MPSFLVAALLIGTPSIRLDEDSSAKGLRLLFALNAKMKEVQRLDCAQHFEAEIQPGKFLHCTCSFKVAREPFRHWSVLECQEPKVREMTVFDGKNSKTSLEGKAASRELAFPEAYRFVAGWGAAQPVQALNMLMADSMQFALDNRTAVFLQSEAVEGEPCDVIQWSRTGTLGTEATVTFNLIWISQKTGWPKAIQRSSLMRGRLGHGARQIFDRFDVNPNWSDDPFAYTPKAEDSYGSLDTSVEVSNQASWIGRTLPSIDVQDPAMKVHKLSEFIHGPTVITFWAPWCGPCRAEMDAMPKIKAFAELGVKVIAIGVSDTKSVILKTIPELPSKGFTHVIDIDAEGNSSRLGKLIGFTGIPTSLAISKDGKVLDQWTGFTSAEELDQRIRKAFRK